MGLIMLYHLLKYLSSYKSDSDKWDLVNAYARAGKKRALLRCLRSRDIEFRNAAACALGGLGDKSVRDDLLPLMKDPKTFYMAFHALRDLGLLTDELRSWAYTIYLADDTLDQSAIKAIVDLQDDKAAFTLLRYLRTLKAHCFTRDDQDKLLAPVRALRAQRDENAVPIFTRLLGGENADVRREACDALRELGVLTGQFLVDKSIADIQYGLSSEDFTDAIDTICQTAGEEVLPKMAALIDIGVPNKATAAIKIIARIGGQKATERILALLHAPNQLLRRAAYASLRNVADLGSALRTEKYLEGLRDPDADVVVAVIECLEGNDEGRVAHALRQSAVSSRGAVRDAACLALSKLGLLSADIELAKFKQDLIDPASGSRRDLAYVVLRERGVLSEDLVVKKLKADVANGHDLKRACSVLESMGVLTERESLRIRKEEVKARIVAKMALLQISGLYNCCDWLIESEHIEQAIELMVKDGDFGVVVTPTGAYRDIVWDGYGAGVPPPEGYGQYPHEQYTLRIVSIRGGNVGPTTAST